jgi:hypothetical protein
VLHVRRSEKISLLISRRFPDAGFLENATGARAEELRRYKRELADLTDYALEQQYVSAFEEEAREKERVEELSDRIQFFNRPEAISDYPYWCTLKSWTLEEAAALLLGKDPRKVNWRTLSRLETTSPFARRLDRLRSQLLRAKSDDAVKDADSPSHLVDWALAAGISVPPDLISALENRGTGPTMEGRERASLLKLVLGMATKHYEFKPAASKSPVPKQIADDLAEAGLQINPETVRKFLREAIGLLPVKTNKIEL